MADSDTQLAIAERLQMKLLQRWERLLNGASDVNLSPTEAGIIAKTLSQNGWSLDPSRLPKGIKDKLLAGVDPTQFADDDPDVLPMHRAG